MESSYVIIQYPRIPSSYVIIQYPGIPSSYVVIQYPRIPSSYIIIQYPGIPSSYVTIQYPGMPSSYVIIQYPGIRSPGLFRTEGAGQGRGEGGAGGGHGGCMHSHQCWMTWYHITSWPDKHSKVLSKLVADHPSIHLVHSFICSLVCFPSTSHYRAQDW